MISKAFSIILISIHLCSVSISCKNSPKLLENIQIEFQPQTISGGILNKFNELFEDVHHSHNYSDLDDLEEDLLDEEYDDEEIYSEEYPVEDYQEAEEELSSLINNISGVDNEELDDAYKTFVYKLCVLTAISQETTIYASESKRV